MAAAKLREIKVYVTEVFYNRVASELPGCSCTMTGFIRMCVAKELVARDIARRQSSGPRILAGQKTLEEGME